MRAIYPIPRIKAIALLCKLGQGLSLLWHYCSSSPRFALVFLQTVSRDPALDLGLLFVYTSRVTDPTTGDSHPIWFLFVLGVHNALQRMPVLAIFQRLLSAQSGNAELGR